MMDRTLFQLQQTFIGEETNHTFFYEVEIPAGCERLVIDFGYTPKRLEDKALAAEYYQMTLDLNKITEELSDKDIRSRLFKLFE